MRQFDKFVLGESPGLHDQVARLAGVQVDKLKTCAVSSQFVDESSHVGWQARPRAVCIEVADGGAQQPSRVHRLRCPHCHLRQPLGVDRSGGRGVVRDQGLGIAGFVQYRLEVSLGILVLGLQDLLGPVRVLAVVVLEARQFGVGVALLS